MIPNNIRIYDECEGRIEKSVPRIAAWHHEACRVMTDGDLDGRIEKSVQRIAAWHHEACRVMTDGDLEGRIFLSYPHTHHRLFFVLTTVFIYLFIYFKISFKKSLNTPRCNFV